MPPRPAALTVTVYGGVAGCGADGEIGGNKILVEWDERVLLLDFGTRFFHHGPLLRRISEAAHRRRAARLPAHGSLASARRHLPRFEWFEQRWAPKVIRAGYGIPVEIE